MPRPLHDRFAWAYDLVVDRSAGPMAAQVTALLADRGTRGLPAQGAGARDLPQALVAKASREREPPALGLGADQSEFVPESGPNPDWFASLARWRSRRSATSGQAHPPSVML